MHFSEFDSRTTEYQCLFEEKKTDRLSNVRKFFVIGHRAWESKKDSHCSCDFRWEQE